ncbi:DUF805 domain-containing protein [Yanghanlia caeni]|uniref:DUF805 domain-containing protein n=1 Tax=Yanghanlia caeni TaxID=3064283 RepID=A0ABU1D883_9BURK|nr:DUF805 domain-containing protein [Alcaligenaceae bacterium LG-2]NGR09567.1 DUF805 domain-containing protein [bacterium SGD-2]HZH57513.1 DUF805 domain-containing protein [Burkholderiaceae bacterium]
MDFKTAVTVCLRKYARFDGRASRSEFWWFYLFTVLAMSAASLVSRSIGDPNDVLGTIVMFGLLVPSLSAGCRRLHDVGRSGWWQVLSLTLIGLIPLVYWMVQPTQPGENKYGTLLAS